MVNKLVAQELVKLAKELIGAKPKKTRDGRMAVKFKLPRNPAKDDPYPKWRKLIDKESVAFTGSKCAEMLLPKKFDNPSPGRADNEAYSEYHRFKGKNGKWYTLYLDDTENPRGPRAVIIESKRQS